MADDADDQTSDRFLEVYLLWLFGWVLFCESAGDFVSRCMIPWAQWIADAPLEQMPQISLGSAVLAATYTGPCSAVTRPTSREAILLWCPLLLQMWIHERFDIGRPRMDLSDYEAWHRPSGPLHHGFPVVSLEGNDLPLRDSSRYDFCSSIHLTFLIFLQHVWAGEQPKKAYKDFFGQIDRMVDAQVRWTPYTPAIVAARAPQGLLSPETRPTG
jgi:hypothetical protein